MTDERTDLSLIGFPCCPKCEADEWENTMGVVSGESMRKNRQGMIQLTFNVRCFECEHPYSTLWSFVAVVEEVEGQ